MARAADSGQVRTPAVHSGCDGRDQASWVSCADSPAQLLGMSLTSCSVQSRFKAVTDIVPDLARTNTARKDQALMMTDMRKLRADPSDMLSSTYSSKLFVLPLTNASLWGRLRSTS